jgi:DNA ligase-1
MMLGDMGELARLAILEGEKSLKEVRIRLFIPIKPMLAEMVYDIRDVIREHDGRTAFEFKFDGVRIQIHKRKDQTRIFSRRLTDVTESLPDIATLVKSGVKAHEALVEGEVVGIGENKKPLPFQELMRRIRRVHNVGEAEKKIPLSLYLFDILYLNGEQLVDVPYEKRRLLLEQTCPDLLVAPRIITSDIIEIERFLEKAVKAGHEGLMAKRLDGTYTPGARGKNWFKIKSADELDLVVIAAEWGYGRRTGWLSNYHLAARSRATGEFMTIGKTFKGLTDGEFQMMTTNLQKIKISEDRYVVNVKPSIVVQVAYNEIQKSPQYKSGFALRFARIKRIREDKIPSEVNTIEDIHERYEQQFRYKAKTRSFTA